MPLEFVLRFVIGGIVVSAFSLIGTVLRPRTLAGIFSAAPSVALATLGLTFLTKGGSVAATEGKSMIAGALAFCAYALVTAPLLLHRTHHTLLTAASALLVWLLVAFALWDAFLR